MTKTEAIDQTRQNAIELMERKEKIFKWSCIGIGLYELVFIILLVYFTDFSNSTHLVIFVATFLIYGTLGLTMVAFGIYLNQGIERMLKGLELLELSSNETKSEE